MTLTTSSVLQKISASVLKRLRVRQEQVPLEKLRLLASRARTPHDFKAAFLKANPPIKTISEIKFTSPALGKLSEGDVNRALHIANAYLQNGTTAISVLTEEDHFNGKLEYLRAIRLFHADALLLMKDFILEEYQILEARVAGADCILLIVALLGKDKTRELMKLAQAQGLSILVEVHDENELADALAIEAPLIGVNNRNLKTLEVSLETSFRLLQDLKKQQFNSVSSKYLPPFISESGIQSAAEIKKLSQVGYSGFLVGSSLMSTPDAGAALAKLLKESAS